MTPLGRVAALAAALVAAGRVAGAEADDGLTVWAALAYISHGEKTPLIGNLRPLLTPEGARQMWRQGSAFRRRYLTGGGNGTRSTLMQNMSVDALDNSQLTIASQANQWVATGALAFMQGLYPPQTDAIVGDLGHNYVVGGNSTDYPLNGYQYPLIQTLSARDVSSVGLQGDVGCPAWDYQVETNITRRPDVLQKILDTNHIYMSLFGSKPFQGVVSLGVANYVNAMEMYDLASYMYAHNETVFKQLASPKEVMSVLSTLAFASERDKSGYNNTAAGDALGLLYSVAGRTLASKVSGHLSAAVAAGGARGRMTLLFGSPRPLVSFLSVGGLLTRENLASGPLSRLPGPGAALIFELVSDGGWGSERAFPAARDLSVRFYYKASADANETTAAYPLFGSGLDGATIPYTAFTQRMADRGLTATQWCDVCRAGASWCLHPSLARSSMDPAVGGVIGAVLSAAFICLVASVCFQFRKPRRQPSGKTRLARLWGGLRGARKKGAADADVGLSKDGAREARTGSWEMQHGARAGTADADAGAAGSGAATRDLRHVEDDDGASISGPPVKARETV